MVKNASSEPPITPQMTGSLTSPVPLGLATTHSFLHLSYSSYPPVSHSPQNGIPHIRDKASMDPPDLGVPPTAQLCCHNSVVSVKYLVIWHRLTTEYKHTQIHQEAKTGSPE